MTTALLDVNVLVALSWPSHVLHASARRWFADPDRGEWATTTVTEAGFLRVSMNPRVVDQPVSWTTARRALESIRAVPGHRLLADDVDLARSEVVQRAPVVGHRQVTDVHLVALAAHHGVHLATFDRGVTEAVHADHRPHVTVLPAR